MNDLLIRMKKHPDGRASLTCVRADGTSTWQTPKAAQGHFFAQHDLTHYAVETILGCRQGFYGLLADGWNITDFGVPWPRGPMPAEALAGGHVHRVVRKVAEEVLTTARRPRATRASGSC